MTAHRYGKVRADAALADERMDPIWATNAFQSAMTREFKNGRWMTEPVGVVCQGVQRSQFGERYQPEARDGQLLAEALWSLAAPPPPPDPHGQVYDRGRSASGVWAKSATRVDTNRAIEGITALAAATMPTAPCTSMRRSRAVGSGIAAGARAGPGRATRTSPDDPAGGGRIAAHRYGTGTGSTTTTRRQRFSRSCV